jgi:hypothetical protein
MLIGISLGLGVHTDVLSDGTGAETFIQNLPPVNGLLSLA